MTKVKSNDSPESSSTDSNSSDIAIYDEIEKIKKDISGLNFKIDRLYELIIEKNTKQSNCFNGFKCNVGINTEKLI